eukprot:Gregarina_sp_Pseudo_9__3714@NODE_3864_length_540_cov_9_748503_g3542_i0_p2_GENE_NODE_3864_length_540_cov_9_748503_g3542_i0NODE_3864_length_540_cov_9_748503_g3542_i0_p2_ORF_typecomplete_len128_score29_78_NODE_3864_length_540_cov_9_748503_g3542_i063446
MCLHVCVIATGRQAAWLLEHFGGDGGPAPFYGQFFGGEFPGWVPAQMIPVGEFVDSNPMLSGIPHTALPQLDNAHYLHTVDPQPSNWTAVSSFDHLPASNLPEPRPSNSVRRGRDVRPAYEPPADRL